MSVLSFLQDRRLVWPGYILVMCLLSALFFGSLKDHLLDVHDHETFQDNIAIGEDFSFFFSPEKQQPTGRPAADLVKYVAYEIGGTIPASSTSSWSPSTPLPPFSWRACAGDWGWAPG